VEGEKKKKGGRKMKPELKREGSKGEGKEDHLERARG
jgi:hypothetical protein